MNSVETLKASSMVLQERHCLRWCCTRFEHDFALDYAIGSHGVV
jgi:hypothetical protein